MFYLPIPLIQERLAFTFIISAKRIVQGQPRRLVPPDPPPAQHEPRGGVVLPRGAGEAQGV